MFKFSVYIIFFINLFFLNLLQAQQVGLVLSGGGAKGLAHIGVIRVLEKNHIPIDYITGTSIGAVIGGLYAIGYSPNEMETFVKSNTFEKWSKGKVDEKYIYYFKKKDPTADFIDLKFSFGDSTFKPQFPSNILPTDKMDFDIMELMMKAIASADYNFDNLFIPYRCVASDIYHKKSINLKDGDLASAIRSSMTYPFFFKPIKINNNLMFDGGLYNNFPLDVMEKDFNPDIIIGSKVSSNSLPPEDDDLMLQLENMLMQKTNFSIPKEKGVLIEPVVQHIGLSDLTNIDSTISEGEKATLKQIETIKKMISRRVDTIQLIKKRKAFKATFPEVYFKDIYIEGVNSVQKKYLKKSIQQKQNIISIEQLKSAYFKILADDKISSIYPKSKFNLKTGYYDLYLNVKKAKRFQAKVGGNISSSSISQGFLGLEFKNLNYSSTNLMLNAYFGRFYTSTQLTGRIDFATKKPFFIDMNLSFNRWDYFKSYSDVFYDDIRPSYLIHNEGNLQINFSMPVKVNWKLTLAPSVSYDKFYYYQTQYFLKADTADKTKFKALGFRLLLEKNTLNYKQFANEGVYFGVKGQYIYAQELHEPGSTSFNKDIHQHFHSYFQAKLIYDKYIKVHRRFSFAWYWELLLSNKKLLENYTSTMLSASAFQPTSHSKTLFLKKYRANNYFSFGLKSIFHLFDNFDFRAELYIFKAYRPILENSEKSAIRGEILSNEYFMESFSLIYYTPLGPASLSFNYYEKKDRRAYFLFNFGYILFNRKAIF